MSVLLKNGETFFDEAHVYVKVARPGRVVVTFQVVGLDWGEFL